MKKAHGMSSLLMAITAGAALSGLQVAAHASEAVENRQPPISPARARSLFTLHCAGCHQINGSGLPQAGVPSLQNTLAWFLGLPEGRAYLVQVPGARNATVTDAELAALTNWELQTFSKSILPTNFTPYTEAEVQVARRNPPADITAARGLILNALETAGKLPLDAKESLKVLLYANTSANVNKQ
jgi:mono/diheme cytochrome c family protein